MTPGTSRPEGFEAVDVCSAGDVGDAGVRGAPRRNVELKAIDPDPGRSLAICRELGAEDSGVLWQRDTYFTVPNGRLKLREQTPGDPHLIQYDRADRPEQRLSAYRLVPVTDAAGLREALATAVGIRGVVEKRRHLFLWQGVRIHLDEVSGLGAFIEFEAVAPPESDLTREHALVNELREVFGVGDERLRAQGYAALLGL